ncbi:MAG: hypothetical protein AB8B84_18635 [Granulosicoccus sp.]
MGRLSIESDALTFWQKYAKAIFIVAMVLFVSVLLIASVRMVNIAISTQSECVVKRDNSTQETVLQAAKHAC